MSNISTTVESTSPAFDVQEFTDFGADIDLMTASFMKQPARSITILSGTGTLELQMVDPNAVTNRTVTSLAEGEKLEPIQVRKIIAAGSSGITRIRVYW